MILISYRADYKNVERTKNIIGDWNCPDLEKFALPYQLSTASTKFSLDFFLLLLYHL